MALLNTFSRRKRTREKTGEDVYQYVDMSPKLRRQILYILQEMDQQFNSRNDLYVISKTIVKQIRKETGRLSLAKSYTGEMGELDAWFMAEKDLDLCLDAVELSCRLALRLVDISYSTKEDNITRAIAELNARMLEDGFGFQFVDSEIVEISTTFTHEHIVLPALGLLSDPIYTTANSEFREAHKEFRSANYEDCIHDCCNAFESVLKIIAKQKKWAGVNDNSNASTLLKAAYDNGLVPSYMQSAFTGLRSMLEGVAAVRNKSGGHGAGTTPRKVDKHLAAFQLHQTGAAILFLTEAAK